MSRFALMALGMMALVAGLGAGLVRIGWSLHTESIAMLHGPLMVCGFLGTLISLERAVALGRTWSFGGPLLVGAGGLLLIGDAVFGPILGGSALSIGALFITAGSLVLPIIFLVVWRIQAAPFVAVMGAGALAWFVGNLLWLVGTPMTVVVWWWMGFLILTIAGERLELSRVLMHAPHVQRTFLALMGLFGVGVLAATSVPGPGERLLGLALLLVGLWLLRFDVVRRTVRQKGLTRYIAWCLIPGYLWLMVGGAMLAAFGMGAAPLMYDAVLHAVFVGFVFSMIFGHAPIIFPSVLRVPLAYRSYYYGHLIVLHGSLILRIAGDLAGLPGLRRWGGMLNAVAIVAFLVGAVASVLSEKRRMRSAADQTSGDVELVTVEM